MKYEMERVESEKRFQPFKLTLTFENKDDYLKFHNEIMPRITNTFTHKFHGHFRAMGGGVKEWSTGEI